MQTAAGPSRIPIPAGCTSRWTRGRADRAGGTPSAAGVCSGGTRRLHDRPPPDPSRPARGDSLATDWLSRPLRYVVRVRRGPTIVLTPAGARNGRLSGDAVVGPNARLCLPTSDQWW